MYFSKLGYSGNEIGQMFKVTKSHVSRILNNLRWKKLK
jgi:DNA-directed RNA polymerase specialized sigma subunit